jgi:formylglycine-generating enzyme required for sulfatase activity
MRWPAVLTLIVVLAIGCIRTGQCAPPPQPSTDDAATRRWALLIGVEDYINVEKLHYCGADMRALRDRLIGSGFPDKQVFLLHDKSTETKYRPMKANILRELKQVLGLVEPGDLIVLGFSGHGVYLDGKSYLCPAEAQLGDMQSLISLDTVYSQLENCPASFKLLLVDACRNDPRRAGQKGILPEAGTKQFAQSLEQPPEGILLLSSCAPGEMSMEDKDFGHGVFMNFLLEGLGGKAADREGRVSLLELYRYAQKKTEIYVHDKFSDSQRPNLKGDIQGDFNIAMLRAGGHLPGMPGSPAGEKVISNSLGMKFMLVPHGKFLMGTPASSSEGYPAERPQHPVEISRDFYLGAAEVTQGQFEKVMGNNPSYFSPNGDGSATLQAGEDAGTLPVENVSYDEALAFCKKLASLDQPALGTYRLPTEAEWEYAARGGPGGVAVVSETQLPQAAWYKPNSDYRAHPVASKTPNALGLYDMLGNVAEWCSDWYDETFYAQADHNGHDPQGPAVPNAEGLKVIRGGSFATSATFCRPADRHAERTNHRNNSLGFRVVLVPGGTE